MSLPCAGPKLCFLRFEANFWRGALALNGMRARVGANSGENMDLLLGGGEAEADTADDFGDAG